MEGKSASRRLAEWTVDVEFKKIPRDAIDRAKIHFLDWFLCMIAGSSTWTGRRALKTAENIFSGDQKFFSFNLSPVGIAFASGVLSHVLEMDDLHRKSILHPASPIISSVFASSFIWGSEGKDILEGVIAGYDAGISVGEVLGKEHYRMFHTTATAGLFGGIAGSGKIAGLSEDELVWAFGNGGSFTSGLWEFLESGGDTKPLHPGKSAFESILLVEMAKNGLRGPSKIFEGNRGVCRILSGNCNLDAFEFKNHRIGEVSLKLYPSCRHTHPVIDAVLKSGVSWKGVERIAVYTYRGAIEVAGIRDPENVFEARFSIPYCVSIALLHGSVNLKHFSEEYIHNRTVRELMKRVRVLEDRSLSEEFPEKWGARVIFEGKETVETRVEFPRGDPENRETMEELMSKYESMMDYSGYEVDIREIAKFTMSMEKRGLEELLEIIKPL